MHERWNGLRVKSGMEIGDVEPIPHLLPPAIMRTNHCEEKQQAEVVDGEDAQCATEIENAQVIA